MSVVKQRRLYTAQAAREARSVGYGDETYWEYLESHAQELRQHLLRLGDVAAADRVLTRTLAEALRDNDCA